MNAQSGAKRRQKALAEHYKQKLRAARVFASPIVTEITAFREFSPAENYHQQYYVLNGHHPYCQIVIRPKIDNLEKRQLDPRA